MSSTYSGIRMRWASKEMRVVRWLKKQNEACEIGEPLVEISVDGKLTPVPFLYDDPPCTARVYYMYVKEGDEVGVWGNLIEYSCNSAGLRYPDLHQTQLHDLGLMTRELPFERRPSYPPIFVSYRHADTEAHAGRLHEVLAREFGGEGAIFMDQFSILPGEPYPWAIQQAAAHCRVMIALIGPDWLTPDASGKRQIDNQHDYLRREITAALDRRIPVVPVLVQGARVPRRSELPVEMQGLEVVQMFDLTVRYWARNAAELIQRIRDLRPIQQE